MNRQEALKIMGFAPMSTPSERDIKKAFKKRALKYHPDRNSSEDAEAKFKEFNAAQTILLNPEKEEVPLKTVSNWDDIISHFVSGTRNRRKRPPNGGSPHIHKKVSLSFKESVLGCNKDVEIDRFDMCKECEGMGEFETHDPCHTCEGKGRSPQVRGRIVLQVPCEPCEGTGKSYEKCTVCAGGGGKIVSARLSVKIPGGVHTGQTIQLRNAGNNVPGHGLARGTVFILINVSPDNNMRLEGRDVISTVEISLYEALKGTTKKVNTVKGEAALIIKAKSRNKEEARLIGYGAEGQGDHRFVLDVRYPDDVTKIIDVLDKKE